MNNEIRKSEWHDAVMSQVSARKPSTVFYFATGILVIGWACWELVCGNVVFASPLLCISGMIYFAPGAALTRGYTSSKLWPRAVILIVVPVVALVSRHFAVTAIGTVISHPVFVVSLWLYLMWGLVGRWRWLARRVV